MMTKLEVLRRLLSTLPLGYILFFYSETMFLGKVEAGGYSIRVRDDVVVYSVLAFFVLIMANYFRAGDVYSVFLVGGGLWLAR